MGRDFTNYGEIRIKKVPEELKRLIRAEAKELGMDERGVMLMHLWGAYRTPDRGAYRTPEGDAKTPISTPKGPPEEKYALPEWVPRVAWGHFEEMRRKVRKPMTETAKKLAVGELEKLRGQGQDPEKVLEQSVYRGWQGLFPVEAGNGEGRRLTASEERTKRAIDNLNELYPLDSGATDAAGGGEGGDDREAAPADVRRGLKGLGS